jgi:hypothetical protein
MTVTHTIQQSRIKEAGMSGVDSIGSLARAFIMRVASNAFNVVPPYCSNARDDWMWDFWHVPGNDLLAGAISTLQAKISAANWYIEGPAYQAKLYREILLHNSEFGAGWDNMIPKWVGAYLSRDAGGRCERLRSGPTDRSGPALGFAHLDESKCRNTGNGEFPVYYNDNGTERKVHRANLMHIVDMPSSKDADKGFGFCSISRAIVTALILMMIAKYKRERLSDLPPAGLLLLNNISPTTWEDNVAMYDVRQENEGNDIWRDIMVLCGYDPAEPITADLFEFARVPEGFDEKTAVEISVYTFALAFRVDPREIWPVSAGPLGTATEAEIQHRKAKAKGEGIIFTAIERQFNDPLSLPDNTRFHFDYRDDEDDMRAAEIASAKIGNVRKMWEASPNRNAFGAGGEAVPGEMANEIESRGMITTEEARRLLAMDRLIPPEWVNELTGIERLYDVKSFGPIVRVYRDGLVIPL